MLVVWYVQNKRIWTSDKIILIWGCNHMKTLILSISLLALTACVTGEGKLPADVPMAQQVAEVVPMAQQVAEATCSQPRARRDERLRNEQPPVAQEREWMVSIEIDPETSGVFQAYAAWKTAGMDHDAAAAAFGSGYPELASCFAGW